MPGLITQARMEDVTFKYRSHRNRRHHSYNLSSAATDRLDLETHRHGIR
jgi:hypothetical protein